MQGRAAMLCTGVMYRAVRTTMHSNMLKQTNLKTQSFITPSVFNIHVCVVFGI